METPHHIISTLYWLSLKSSQSPIEDTGYIEGNIGDIRFSWKRVFLFLLPAVLLCADGKFANGCMLSGFLM